MYMAGRLNKIYVKDFLRNPQSLSDTTLQDLLSDMIHMRQRYYANMDYVTLCDISVHAGPIIFKDSC